MKMLSAYSPAALLILGSAFLTLPASAASKGAVNVDDLDISRKGDKLRIEMSLNAASLRMPTNRETVYTPMLVNGTDTLRLRSFTIAGRNRYYTGIRADGESSILQAGKIKKPIDYKETVIWQPWMETARLEVEARDCGCCSKPIEGADKETPIAQLDFAPKAFEPQIEYVTPEAEAVKIRQISAKAYVDFPVNQTKIYPDYRRNPQELAKIRATIDSVRADKNVSITGISIHGYASPEGSYANNAKLAEGRTLTLAEYVRSLYSFKKDMLTTQWTPEDWAGLREYVASSEGAKTLSDREALLALLDNPAYTGRDDEREALLRSKFPADYKYLLANVYPGLRHSDYAVKFSVRSFTQPAEIIEMMKKAPQNLSLQELFVAARSQKPGSALYNEAFEIAARMYPQDPVANLNAGCAALQSGDLSRAARYLDKAGDSKEARYARAVLTAMEGDKAAARQMMAKIADYAPAGEALRQLDTILDTDGTHFRQLTDQF